MNGMMLVLRKLVDRRETVKKEEEGEADPAPSFVTASPRFDLRHSTPSESPHLQVKAHAQTGQRRLIAASDRLLPPVF